MKNFKLRELSPIVISVIILSIFLVGLTSAAVSNGKIGDLFFFDTLSLKYKLYGTNVLPIFGTQNITTTGFIKGKNGKFTNKVTSASTVVLDSGTILTTKDYVESFANNAANSAKDNLGNHIATQDLNMSGSKIINLANPTLSTDVTNKGYVDTKVAGMGGGGVENKIILNKIPGNYSWTAPNNILFIEIIGCGGGGGGSRDNIGGGGGGCAQLITKVTPGKTYLYTVGNGGYRITGGKSTGGQKSLFSSCTLGGGGGGSRLDYGIGGGGGGGPWGGGGGSQGGIGGNGGGGKGGTWGNPIWNGENGTILGLSLIGTNGGDGTAAKGGQGGNACVGTVALSAGNGGAWAGSGYYGPYYGAGGIGKYGCNGGKGGANFGWQPGKVGCIVIKQYTKILVPTNSL